MRPPVSPPGWPARRRESAGKSRSPAPGTTRTVVFTDTHTHTQPNKQEFLMLYRIFIFKLPLK